MHAIIYRAAAAFGWLGFCSGFCLAQTVGTIPAAGPDLVVNGDFEQGDSGWSALWTRDGKSGKATLDRNERHAGSQGLRIEVKGDHDWSHGGRSVRETKGWVPLRSRFVIPPNTASIECRLIGDGTATVWFDDVVLTRKGNLDALRNPKLPATLTVHSSSLEVTLHTADGSLECKAPGGERSWIQHSDAPAVVVLDAKATRPGGDPRDRRHGPVG
jgi:hypothetical protein